MIRPILKKIPYELWKCRKSNISHLRAFGYKCFVLNNNKDNLEKFDTKSDKTVFFGYSNSSKAYRVFNKRTLLVEESVHVAFDESNNVVSKNLVSDDTVETHPRMESIYITNKENPSPEQKEEITMNNL